MNEKEVKHWWNIIKNRPFLVISLFIISFAISWGTLHFIYSETISSKDSIIENKQILIDGKQEQIESFQETISEKDDLIEGLRHDILKFNIKNNALNISIQNNNIQANSVWNWSCSEKDIVINEFAQKITEQDTSLIICQNNLNSLESEYKELEKQIPAYDVGFVGKDISVGVGGTYQADRGKFILSVTDTHSGLSVYRTTFRLNGIGYTKNIGEFIIFDYYGENYTINLKSTGNPAHFYIYKTGEYG